MLASQRDGDTKVRACMYNFHVQNLNTPWYDLRGWLGIKNNYLSIDHLTVDDADDTLGGVDTSYRGNKDTEHTTALPVYRPLM